MHARVHKPAPPPACAMHSSLIICMPCSLLPAAMHACRKPVVALRHSSRQEASSQAGPSMYCRWACGDDDHTWHVGIKVGPGTCTACWRWRCMGRTAVLPGRQASVCGACAWGICAWGICAWGICAWGVCELLIWHAYHIWLYGIQPQCMLVPSWYAHGIMGPPCAACSLTHRHQCM